MPYSELVKNFELIRDYMRQFYVYGFKNRKLGSITGKDWSLTPMPHPMHDDDRTIIARNIYLLYEDRFIQLDLCHNNYDGVHLIAQHAQCLEGDHGLVIFGKISAEKQYFLRHVRFLLIIQDDDCCGGSSAVSIIHPQTKNSRMGSDKL
mgnify:CR=1 FL=1